MLTMPLILYRFLNQFLINFVSVSEGAAVNIHTINMVRCSRGTLALRRITRPAIKFTGTCPCGTESMTVQHVLGRCPNLAALRRETWPEGTYLQDQLHWATYNNTARPPLSSSSQDCSSEVNDEQEDSIGPPQGPCSNCFLNCMICYNCNFVNWLGIVWFS